MPFVTYLRLIAFTAGTLVYLFILALILGHRRPRPLERLLFFTALSAFLIYAGFLLGLNAFLAYGSPPRATTILYKSLVGLGLAFLPVFLLQTHWQYYRLIHPTPTSHWRGAVTYLFVLFYFPVFVFVAVGCVESRSVESARVLADWVERILFLSWVSSAIFASSMLDIWIVKSARSAMERRFFLILPALSVPLGIGVLVTGELAPGALFSNLLLVSALWGVLPGAVFIYFALKHNFLEYGAQRNLVYALSATFLALLYFALVRRVSGWLEPVLPPEATAAILIFVLIFLFEPLERLIGPALHRRFHERFGRLQALAAELQEQARHGDVAKLLARAERRVQEEFGLAAVRISVPRERDAKPLESPGGLGHTVQVPLMKEGREIGVIEAASTGSYLTGETSAALEFLAEQLPAMMDLCRLIEEKVRLERELAERERLALLGQMAASVSHNLRNPLSSMKTVLQVQLENPGLPFDVRHDCALVVGEIDRMSAKLTQLLRFAKPSVNGQRVAAVALAKQTAALFGRDAERRNVRLEFSAPSAEVLVLASEEALSEVLSNLIVNGIEAQPEGGRVRIGLASATGRIEIVVEDDGPGISKELRGKIFEPYFTTKATGTGLGLSIVARRVAEMGGTIACESPLREGTGTRFRLTLPLAEETGR